MQFWEGNECYLKQTCICNDWIKSITILLYVNHTFNRKHFINGTEFLGKLCFLVLWKFSLVQWRPNRPWSIQSSSQSQSLIPSPTLFMVLNYAVLLEISSFQHLLAWIQVDLLNVQVLNLGTLGDLVLWNWLLVLMVMYCSWGFISSLLQWVFPRMQAWKIKSMHLFILRHALLYFLVRAALSFDPQDYQGRFTITLRHMPLPEIASNGKGILYIIWKQTKYLQFYFILHLRYISTMSRNFVLPVSGTTILQMPSTIVL